jgi:VWFA-related protein
MNRIVRRWLGAAVGVIALAAWPAAQQPQPQTPVFRSSVEVTSIDVGVVDDRGRPVTNLQPADFSVQIDGADRRVVSAEWISLVTPARPDAPPPPPGYSTNENSTGGRLIMIVIDQPNIRFGGAVVIRSAVNGFLEHLQPSDRVAVIGLGPGGPPSTSFTSDRRRLQETVARMVGTRLHQGGTSRYTVTLSEALQIQRQEPGVLERVIDRECAGEPDGPRRQLCESSVESEAITVATQSTSDGDMTLSSLRALIEAVRHIDAPKTMILVTEGFVMGDRLIDVQNLGSFAAAARTSIYALRLDETMFSDITQKGPSLTRFEDRQESRVGVETLANAARGSLFNVTVSADGAFERIESELSGYYLLGVESAPTDRNGKPHPVRVAVKRPGMSIRSRRQVMTAGDLDNPRNPRDAVMGALKSPMMVSALPLTVATFPLQGPDPAKIQLLVHAAVGSDYSSSKVVTFGYTITDSQGRIVESLAGDTRLSPVLSGAPSALQYDIASSLSPGEYTLKLAMAEGERVGSVEHHVQAWLTEAPPVRLSELMVGGPVEVRELQRPTIGHVAAFGSVHGYVEAYGPQAAAVKASYEIATSATSPALVTEEVEGRTVGGNRIIFSKVMLIRQVPPGSYVLRAVLRGDAGPIKTLTRDFEVAAPPVLMTSAEVPGANRAATEVYLPVGASLLARAFRPDDALSPATLQLFRERVAPAAQRAFDDGVASMRAKDYAKAERTLKTAIRGDLDSTAALTYLAAVFAAAGYDTEAASTWQTALVDGGDFPQIYQWLGDALMRTRHLAEARTILEEAAEKWPADLRFAKPLAYVYATFGQGREAMRTLRRYLAEHAEDVEALGLGVQWTYELHQTGADARTRAEDVAAARTWANLYEKAKGPQRALVRQWIEFLEKPAR